MGATITVNVKTTRAEAQAIVDEIRRALESVTSEPVNISITEDVTRVDNNAISVYNKRQNRNNPPGGR